MCCIIILSHFEFLGESEIFGEFYKTYLHNPTLAVDYFFMLSGFGIYLSSKRPECSIKGGLKFAVDKVKKIYPAYILSLIYGAFGVCLITDGLIRTIAKLFIFGIADLTLFQSITGMTKFSHSINGVCWFLSTLFICYIVCPWLLRVVDKIRNKKQAWCLLCSFSVIVLVLSLGALLLQINLSIFDDLWYGHPFVRCWFLAIGMCIGYLYKESKTQMSSGQELLAAVLAIIYFLGRNSIPFDKGVLRFLDIALCTFFLYVFACGNGKLSKAFSSKNLVNLGKTSMFLFLFHYPVRSIVVLLFNNIGLTGEWIILVELLLIVLITYLLTYLYGYFEERLKTRQIRRIKNS